MGAKTYRRNPSVIGRSIGEERLLVPTGSDIVESRCLFTLNETAAFIWERLEQPRSLEQLAADLAAEYQVSIDQASEDLGAFLDGLVAEGCILTDEG
ncbi:MAG: PqqD family protein [Deltaproteobacteria bacterium]|nr:PqqD family protein [Deltaproteobacteria bacterium]